MTTEIIRVVNIELYIQIFQLPIHILGHRNGAMIDHLVTVNLRLHFFLLKVAVICKHERDIIVYIFPQLKNRIGIRGAFQKSNHSVIRGGISVNIIPFFVFHIRVLLIVQALCVWERDWQAQLFLRPVPVFP